VTICSADQTKRGMSEAEASKACACSYTEMRKTMTDEEMSFAAAGFRRDQAAVDNWLKTKSLPWVTQVMEKLDKLIPGMEKTCGFTGSGRG
jgi:hypothetical protein